MLDEEFARSELARPGKELPVKLLLPAHQPGPERIFDELQALLFDVRERSAVKIADQMRRHSEDPADLVDLKLARLDELRVIGLERGRRELHSFFEDRYFVP